MRTLIVPTLFLMGTLLPLSCRQQSASAPPSPSVSAQPAYLSMVLVDEPLDDVAHAFISIERIDVRGCAGDDWTPIPAKGTFDLLSLQGGWSASLFVERALPPNRYCEIRYVIQEGATLELKTGERVPVSFPSGTSSGIKLKGEWELRAGVVTRIVTDFDARKSFSVSGNGSWRGHPVLRVSEVTYLAPSTGYVPGASFVARSSFTVDPAVPSVVPLPGGAELRFPKGSTAAPQVFSVTTWKPASDFTSGHVYALTPPYVFASPPEFAAPLAANQVDGTPTVVLDGVSRPTRRLQMGTAVEATIPHFSDICVDNAFPDVSATSEYFPYITFVRCRGIMRGHADGTFRPDDPVTRAEMLTVALNLAYGTTNATNRVKFVNGRSWPIPYYTMPFSDVPQGHWAWDYIAFAVKHGLAAGDSGKNTFRPEDPVNRAEAAQLLLRASEFYISQGRIGIAAQSFEMLSLNFDKEYAISQTNSGFADVEPSDWFFESVTAARAANAYKRKATFNPGGLVTRKEVARLAYLLGSQFNEVRRRLFCGAKVGANCTKILSERVDLSQMFLEYNAINPTDDHHHAGVDFPGENRVHAPVAGTVRRVTGENECGIVVLEDDRNPTDRHIFLHMKDISVKNGDTVSAGAEIGTSSSSEGLGCKVVGAHLHYEIRKNKDTVRPMGGVDDDPNSSTAEQTYNPFDFTY